MEFLSRRRFIGIVSLAGASGLVGCAAAPKKPTLAQGCGEEPWTWTPDEKNLVEAKRPDFDITIKGNPVLRKRTRPVPVEVNLDEVFKRMETAMDKAGGVGIAGPQVGLSISIVVVKLDYKTPTPRTVDARNPRIIARSDETEEGYEGCLSIPGVGGMVRRNRWIKVEYVNTKGETVIEEAEGYNAVLWQHELDHLDGILYTDRLLGELIPMEEVRRLRKEKEEREKREKERQEKQKSEPPAAANPSSSSEIMNESSDSCGP